MPAKMDLGIVAEGIIEMDPMTGRMVIRVTDEKGKNVFVDVQEALSKYKGQEVRFICTPFDTIGQLAEMVEKGELPLEQVPTLKMPSH